MTDNETGNKYLTNCIHHQVCQGAYNCQTKCQYFEERPQGDLISREALKKAFAKITYIRFTADMGQGGYDMFSEKEIEDIRDKAPTVEQERSHD